MKTTALFEIEAPVELDSIPMDKRAYVWSAVEDRNTRFLLRNYQQQHAVATGQRKAHLQEILSHYERYQNFRLPRHTDIGTVDC